jgi:hypothetical protein
MMTAALTKAQADYYGQQQRSPPPVALTKEQRSLIKLAKRAIDLHALTVSRGYDPPRSADGASQPLALALTCLNSAARHQ